MKSLNEIALSPLYFVLCLVSIGLIIGQAVDLLRAVRNRRGKKRILSASLGMLLDLLIFVWLMDFSMTRIYSPEDYARLQAFQLVLFDMPWLLCALAEIAAALILALLFRDHAKFRKTHLTADAIRETIDLLPEGISIIAPDGTVALSNLKMNELCRRLTGSGLFDGNRFFKCIEERGEEQNGQAYVRFENGEVWQFTKRRITTNEKPYTQLTAADVTERYRIIDELKEKNAHLQDVQRRMKAVSDLSGDIFVAQEEANARVALHNQLGQVLLMGRHFLDQPDTTDANMLYLVTQKMNAFLLGEYEESGMDAFLPGKPKKSVGDAFPSDDSEKSAPDVFRLGEPDNSSEGTGLHEGKLAEVVNLAVMKAKSIGVSVEIRGSVPEDEKIRALLADTIAECAANTVKHAEGDYLAVELAEKDRRTQITVTNNGKPPKAKIAESGGLLAIRKTVEQSGGEITVQSSPVFMLTIIL